MRRWPCCAWASTTPRGSIGWPSSANGGVTSRGTGRQGADLDVCLRLDTSPVVPVFEGGVIVSGPRLPGQMAAQERVR